MGVLKQWFVASIGYKLLDVITTIYLIHHRGLDIESNPFAVNMVYAYGATPGLILNGAIVSMLLYALYKHKRKKLLIISTLMLMFIVMTNIATILVGK